MKILVMILKRQLLGFAFFRTWRGPFFFVNWFYPQAINNKKRNWTEYPQESNPINRVITYILKKINERKKNNDTSCNETYIVKNQLLFALLVFPLYQAFDGLFFILCKVFHHHRFLWFLKFIIINILYNIKGLIECQVKIFILYL